MWLIFSNFAGNNKNTPKMKIRLLFSLLLCATAATLPAANVYWFDGRQHVSYVRQKKLSPVVEQAIDLFSADMTAVTGRNAQEKSNGQIVIFQLDLLDNKEFKQLTALHVPINKFIARPEAFYIGLRGQNIVVAGSDARGTAYGLLELSRQAGVSPWTETGLPPERRRTLSMDSKTEILQWPATAVRALQPFSNTRRDFDNDDYRKLFRLMLRLRLNTLVPDSHTEHHATGKAFRHFAQEQGVDIATARQCEGAETLDLAYIGDASHELSLSTPQPGIVAEQLDRAARTADRRPWLVRIHRPTCADFALQLFADMAWSHTPAGSDRLTNGYRTWLAGLFGDVAAQKLIPLMTDYYRLTGICKPELLEYADFNEGEFGNELERYIAAYKSLARRLDSVDGIIDRERKTAYEAAIKYPVTAAAITVEMNLQAQEARNIARPGLFYRDREALAAAANSLRAYDRLKELNARMGNRRPTPMPKLPGKLTDKQVKQYATDEQPELQPLPAQLGSTVALNAAAYSSASAGTARQPMTGHSMNAVRLPRGGVVRYTFMAKEDNPAVVRVATIPRSGTNYQVSIDGTQTQTTYTRIATADLLRGQTVVSFNFRVPKGLHTLEIKALSDGVTVDQWMFDFDINRQFYMFPVTDY